jgi:hypothetical protein
MPAEIEHGHRPNLLAVPFGTDQTVGEIGFPSGRAASLGAPDVHAHTVPGRLAERKVSIEIIWLYIRATKAPTYISQWFMIRCVPKIGEKQAGKRKDGLGTASKRQSHRDLGEHLSAIKVLSSAGVSRAVTSLLGCLIFDFALRQILDL